MNEKRKYKKRGEYCPRTKAFEPTASSFKTDSVGYREWVIEQERIVLLYLTTKKKQIERRELSEVLFMRMRLRTDEKVHEVIDGVNRLQIILKRGYDRCAFSILKCASEHKTLSRATLILDTIRKGAMRYGYDN